jgi:acetyl-CoA acetyltransferase
MTREALRTAAIVGIGESKVGRLPGISALGLQRQATEAALADAGLTLADIDGLLTTPIRVENWAMPCAMVAQELGLRPRYMATLDVAGASGCGMVHHAAMAVATGQANAVLCVGGQDLHLVHQPQMQGRQARLAAEGGCVGRAQDHHAASPV